MVQRLRLTIFGLVLAAVAYAADSASVQRLSELLRPQKVTSGSPGTAIEGALVYATDTKKLMSSNGTTWAEVTTSGPTGANAIAFDNVADRVQSASPPNASAFSVVGFAYITTDTNDWTTIWALEDATAAQWDIFETDSDGLILKMFSDEFGGAYVTAGTFTVGAWKCIGATIDVPNTDTKVYFGDPGGTPTQTTDAHAYGLTATTLSFAANRSAGELLNGRLAGMKVWSVELTQAEVNAECLQLQPVKTADLHAFYAFDATDTMLNDTSGNGRNLTNPSGTGAWSQVAGPFP